MRTIEFRGEKYQQWLAPDIRAAGWHTDSALLGAVGNTVLNGHHNSLGAVFGRLVELEAGDIIQVYSHNSLFTYQVTNRMIVPEKYQQMDTRMANVQWLLPSQDERLKPTPKRREDGSWLIALTELRRKRWNDSSLDEMLEIEGSPASSKLMADRAPGPDALSEQSDMTVRIRRILDQELTPKQREALVLLGIQEVPLEDGAVRMKTNRNALYKLLHDARLRL